MHGDVCVQAQFYHLELKINKWQIQMTNSNDNYTIFVIFQ